MLNTTRSVVMPWLKYLRQITLVILAKSGNGRPENDCIGCKISQVEDRVKAVRGLMTDGEKDENK